MSRAHAKNPLRLTVEVEHLIADRLHFRVESAEQDLFAGGQLDSMSLVQLILELEGHFGVDLPMGELDLQSFRSVNEIAGLIESRLALTEPATQPAVHDSVSRLNPIG